MDAGRDPVSGSPRAGTGTFVRAGLGCTFDPGRARGRQFLPGRRPGPATFHDFSSAPR